MRWCGRAAVRVRSIAESENGDRMNPVPMPLKWADVWCLCTLDLDANDGVRRLGPCHLTNRCEDAWAFGFGCGLEVLVVHHRDAEKGRLWELEGNLPEVQHALEHLGLSDVPVTWRAERSRRYDRKNSVEPPQFGVWRLDDNGNEALVEVLASEATANCVVNTYEGRLHKQTYFVRDVSSHKAD